MRKKIIALTIAYACTLASAQVFAEEESSAPIQIHSSKINTIKQLPDDLPKNPSVIQKQKTLSTKIEYSKKHNPKKFRSKKSLNYNEIDKLIENCYFEDADKILKKAINSNSRNIKAQALWVVSLAKQYKLDPAQNQLDTLLKKYPNNADLHYAQGIIHYRRTTSSNMEYIKNSQKLFEEALKEFKKAIELDKKDARYYNAAGVVSLNLGKNNEAKTLFKQAFQLDKKYSKAIDNLGTIDLMDGNLDEAEKKFNKALEYNTQNTTAMYHLAQVANQRGEYSKALTYLNNALAINSNSFATQNLMGELYAKQGNEAAAINAFKKSVMIKPEFTIGYLNLAEVYEKRGDSEFAIEQLKTALSINPDFCDAKLKLADICLSSGKYNQAIENYSSLVDEEDYKTDALKGLANSYFGQAQVSSNKALLGSNRELFNAFNSINQAIKANNDDLELHLAKLKLAKITDQPVLSHNELQNILNSSDTSVVNTVIKGEAYLSLNNYEEAEKMFNLAAASTKNLDEDLYLTEIFIYNKQYETAKVVLNKILEKDPQNQTALSNLDYITKCEKYAENYFKSAEFFFKSKNKPTALEYLTRSIALNPNNPKAYLLLAQIYEQQKDYQNAILNYEIYLKTSPNTKNKFVKSKIKYLENKIK